MDPKEFVLHVQMPYSKYSIYFTFRGPVANIAKIVHLIWAIALMMIACILTVFQNIVVMISNGIEKLLGKLNI